jgi:hypothetical protein
MLRPVNHRYPISFKKIASNQKGRKKKFVQTLLKKKNWKEFSEAFVPHNRGMPKNHLSPLFFESSQKFSRIYSIDIHR